MVELNHTDIATDEDKLFGIDTWAKLFKAKTWEEIKMITKANPSLNSTAETIFVSTSDEDILEQCRIREDNIAHEVYQNNLIKSLAKENDALTKDNKALAKDNIALTKNNKALSNEIALLKQLLKENNNKIDS